jgi:transcription elongation factor Elf1
MTVNHVELHVTDCQVCGSEFVVPLENGLMPGCIRCPVCGAKSCSAEY